MVMKACGANLKKNQNNNRKNKNENPIQEAKHLSGIKDCNTRTSIQSEN